jgi:hypothetical protein
MLRISRNTILLSLLLAAWVLAVPAAARAEGLEIVVCAPGYPGSTAEAQPAMDGLAAAVSEAAGWEAGTVEAVYFETEEGGLESLRSPGTGLALVTLPFYLEHRAEFDLRPELMAVPESREPLEAWSLVAGKGLVSSPTDLDGWEILSLAGHSPRFVRGPATANWGELPSSAAITFSGAVLSGLRRAAGGETVALLLDGAQAESVARLPFADRLEVVHRSQLLPVSVVCSVGGRIAPDQLASVLTILQELNTRPAAAEALAGIRVSRFVPVDRASLEKAERTFAGAGE